MRLLFVPYHPSKTSQGAGAGGISTHSHAAREHHRKAKLRREALQGPAHPGDRAQRGKGAPPHPPWTPDEDDDDPEATAGGALELANLHPQVLLGAGRVDPFDAYCARGRAQSGGGDLVHEMLDHAVSCQWSLFAPDDTPASLLQVKRSVMELAVHSPVCFHTLVYAGATHKAFFQSPTVDHTKSAVFRLSNKVEAIKALKRAVDTENAATDEIIFAMLLLAIHGNGEKLQANAVHETRPLATAQDAQYYSSLEYEFRHMQALLHIVQARGGLHTIKMPGVAFAIASFDIHTSMMFQKRPMFPPLMTSAAVVGAWPTSQPGSPASEKYSALATGFDLLADMTLAKAADLLRVLQSMRDVIAGCDSLHHRNPEAPAIKPVIFARNLNQHELMSLPDLSTELFSPIAELFDSRTLGEMVIYELCRIGAIVFQSVVLLPNLHDVDFVTAAYAARVRRLLHHAVAELHLERKPAYRDLFLWVAVMCTWLCRRLDSRECFLDFLVMLAGSTVAAAERTDRPTWSEVRDILTRYFWLDAECDAPCQAIWREVEASQIPDEKCVVC